MRECDNKLFAAAQSFRRLNISAILPDLTHSEFGTLKVIAMCTATEKRVGIADVVRHTHAMPSAVSRNLKSLEERGFVLRSIDQKDRRNTYVELTDAGEKILKQSEEVMDDFTKSVLQEMGEENMDRLVSYLTELYEVSKKEIEKRKMKNKEGKENKEDEENI